MKQWMIPMATLLVGAGIAVGATLGVTRPWQSEETNPVSAPQAAFTEQDILQLTQQQVRYGGANGARCVSASFRPGADMWLVTCNLYSDQGGSEPIAARIYTVSDRDGKLVQ